MLLIFFQGIFSTLMAHEPVKFLASLKDRPDASEKIYQAYCQTCHDPHPQIPIGAPQIQDKEEWLKRLKDKKTLLKHTFEGYQMMPARGGCFECSDQQLIQVIEYMIKTKI